MRLDNRHYNAWYGMGQIFYRQEKYDMAEYHFQRSLQVKRRQGAHILAEAGSSLWLLFWIGSGFLMQYFGKNCSLRPACLGLVSGACL